MHIQPITLVRAAHILAGSLWVGGVFLNAMFLIPSVMAAGPAGGQVMRLMVQVRRLPAFMNAVMVTNVISGLWLYGRDCVSVAWITTGTGMSFTIGALCAIATAVVGFAVTLPAVKRMGKLGAEMAGAGGPPSPEHAAEMARLQHRLLDAARVSAVLLAVATLAMAVARYV